jgi:hypothetical protein
MPQETRHAISERKGANAQPFDILRNWNWEQCLGCIAVISLTGFPMLGACIAALLHAGTPHWYVITAIGGAYGLVAGVTTPMLLLGSAWLLHRHSTH